MTPIGEHVRPSRGELVAMLRRGQRDACAELRRRPDWSPARDLDRCACGETLGAHACRMLADLLEAGEASSQRKATP